MVALLRERNYALLWSSASISALGNWLLVAALPYYVYSTTGSTLASGAAIISSVAPMVIFPSIGGIFADRWNRKRVMFWSDWLRGLILLPMLAVHSASTVGIVFVVGFVGSTVAFFAGPFGAASISQLVGHDNLPAANSGFVVGANIGRIAGPFAAGALLATVGLQGVVIADVVTFAASGWLVSLLVFPPGDVLTESASGEPKSQSGRSVREWQAGLTYIRHERLLTTLLVATMLGGIGGGMFNPLLAPFVQHVLGASAQVYGSLVSIRGAGGLLAAITVGALTRRFRPVVIIGWGALLVAAFSLAVDAAPSIAGTLVGIGIAELCGTASFISRQTLFQSSVPDAYRGRVFGTYLSLVALSSIIGTSAGSVLAAGISVRQTMAIGGVVQALAAIALLLWLRGSRDVTKAPSREEEDGLVASSGR